MTRERRVLLTVLVIVAAASVLGLTLSAGIERLAATNASLGVYEERYRRAASGSQPSDLTESVASLAGALREEVDRYYGPNDMDPYRFGVIVQTMLQRDGISVQQFRTTEGKNGTLLQYTTSGTTRAVATFMKEVSESKKYRTMPYFHVQSGPSQGVVTFEFQIGYAVRVDEAAK